MSRLSDAVRNTILAAAAVAAAIAAPLVAQAQTAASDRLSAWERVLMEATFSKADVNDDGQLTRSEAQRLGDFSERFDALDTDHDGFLDLEEFAAGFASAQ